MRSGETIRQGSETEKSSKIKEKQCFWELLKMIKILFVCHGTTSELLRRARNCGA